MKRSCIAVVLLSTLIFTGCGSKEDVNETKGEIISTPQEVEDTDYVVETNYTGADVPAVLYAVPFQKTDSYETNIEIQEYTSDEELQAYLTVAANYCKAVFGNSYLNIEENQEAFLSSIESYCMSGQTFYEGEELVTAEEYAQSLMEFYIDNKIDASVTFDTDRSLVYRDSYLYYVRGALNITINGQSACDAYKDKFGFIINDGETVSIMCEVSFLPGNVEQVAGFSAVAYIE